MQAIRIAESPSGAAFVLVTLATGHAQLMLVGASGMDDSSYADTWDEAVRFCWAAGWTPRQDDADVYVAEIDTEFYCLIEADDALMEEVDEDDADAGHVAG